jgi:hypothetical protein
VTLPWLLFSISRGHLPGGALFHNVAFDVFGRARGVSWDDYERGLQPQFRSLGDVLARDPAGVLNRLLDNLWRHATLDLERLLGWPTAACCALGLVLTVGDGGWRRLFPVWVAGGLLYATLIPVFYSERYSLPLAPVYLSLAGAAVASPLPALRIRGWPVPLKWLLALWPLGLLAAGSAADQQRLLADLPREVRPAAAALRAAASPGSRVLARKPHIGFYSGVVQVPFPIVSTLPQLAAFCRRERVDFLYFSGPEADTRPEFTYLLDPDADVPGLVPVEFPAARPGRLYRIEPGFGARPAWLADDSLRTLYVSRSLESIGAPAWRAALVSGLYALDQRDFAAAARHFDRLTRMRPDFAQGFFLAGEAELNLGEFAAATDAYARAIALDPNHQGARLGQGWARLFAGDVAGAADLWRPLVASTSDPATLNAMAAVFDSVGDREAARRAREAISPQTHPNVTGP